MRPQIPHLADGRQLVMMASWSGKLVVETQRPADLVESLVGLGGSENVPSGFFSPEAASGFVS